MHSICLQQEMRVEAQNVVVSTIEKQFFANQSCVVAELAADVYGIVGFCLRLQHTLSSIPHTTYHQEVDCSVIHIQKTYVVTHFGCNTVACTVDSIPYIAWIFTERTRELAVGEVYSIYSC